MNTLLPLSDIDEIKEILKKFENRISALEDKTKTRKLSGKRSIKIGSSTKQGPMDQLKDLVSGDYFSSPRSMKEILDELDSRGRHYQPADLTSQLNTLVRNKNLRRTKKKIGKKTVIHWTNW